MTDQRISFENWFETDLTAAMGPTDLTASVTSKGTLTTPTLLCIEPDVPAQREYILFDGTFGASTFVTSTIANRYQPGSGAGSNLTHPLGSKVTQQNDVAIFKDLHDRIDALNTLVAAITSDIATLDHGNDLAGLADDDHTQYHTDARGDARYLELDGTGTMTGDLDAGGKGLDNVNGISDSDGDDRITFSLDNIQFRNKSNGVIGHWDETAGRWELWGDGVDIRQSGIALTDYTARNIIVQASAPGGDSSVIWLDTTAHAVKYWSGSAWVAI